MSLKDQKELQTVLKHEESIKDLIGRNTVFKFEFMTDGIARYRTVTPSKDFKEYSIELFIPECGEVFCYDTFNGFLYKYQIFEVKEINRGLKNDKDELIYNQTWLEQYQHKLTNK